MKAKEVIEMLNDKTRVMQGLAVLYYSLEAFIKMSWEYRVKHNFLRMSFGKIVEDFAEWDRDVRSAFKQITGGVLDGIQLSVFKIRKSKFQHPEEGLISVEVWLDYAVVIEDSPKKKMSWKK